MKSAAALSQPQQLHSLCQFLCLAERSAASSQLPGICACSPVRSHLWGYRFSTCQLHPCVVQGALAKPPAFSRALSAGSQECRGGCGPGSSPGAQQSRMFSKACRDRQSICFPPPGLWSWRFPGLEALVSSLFNSFWWFYLSSISPVALCEPLQPPPAVCFKGWDIPWKSSTTFV